MGDDFKPAGPGELTDLSLLPQNVRMLTREVHDGFKRTFAMLEELLVGYRDHGDRISDIELRSLHRDARLDRLELAAGLEPLPQPRARAKRSTPRKKR